MVIAGCLMSPKTSAGTSNKDGASDTTQNYNATSHAQVHIMDDLLNLNLSRSSSISDSELAIALLMWINSNSSFDYNLDELPKIKKVTKVDIAQVAFGKALPAAVNPDTLGIKGLYNFNDQTIYILDTLDLNAEKDRAILLHELVHFLQYQYGDDKGAKCKNELERLAYRLEAKYLQSQNQEIDFNTSHIEKVSKCT
jgi:hypothetical protein